jgi:ubiquitin C-terminal hydrolase
MTLDPIPLDPAVLTGALRELFTCELQFIRTLSATLFKFLPVPMEVFTEVRDFVSADISAEFFSAFFAHINGPCPALISLIKRGIADDSPTLPTLCESLAILLEKGHVAGEDREFFSQTFIEQCLQIDSRPRNAAFFSSATRCLTFLRDDRLYNHLLSLHAGRKRYSDYSIDGDAIPETSSGPSGLTNLGATCFLNATLQQFFAVRPLRNGVIEYAGANAFMVQLRELFLEMHLRTAGELSPKNLVKEWVSWDGEPLDPRVQQDACEFVQMLLDKLEGGLGRDFVKDLFYGTTVDHIEGINVPYQSTNAQPFVTFGLPILGYPNAEAAFKASQLPNFFTGANRYHAEGLGPIDAKKFASLAVLPKHLIIHLSRFEYDYRTGRRTKINQRFEFPVDLDVGPYAFEPKTETNYVLTGVIVHDGFADFGHYVSYVRDSERWLCFNDDVVSTVALDTLLALSSGEARRSAYLLFYTRKDVVDEDVPEPNIDSGRREKLLTAQRQKGEYQLFCSRAYFDFVLSLNDERFARIGIQYYFDTLPFTACGKHAGELALAICKQLKASSELRNFLAAYIAGQDIGDALVYCPDESVTKGASSIIECIPAEEIAHAVLA